MKTRIGAISLFLLLSLSACAGKTHYNILVPPTDLMADCPEPKPRLVTNEDLTIGYLDMRQALRVCNADKAALRAWAVEATAENKD